MKSLKIFIVSMLVLIGCSSVMAQKHRHTERNDSTEAAILEGKLGSSSDANRNLDYTIHIDTDFKPLHDAVDRMIGLADRADSNGSLDFLGGMLGATVWLVVILIFLICLCPLIFIIFVLWLILRPNKKEKNEDRVAVTSKPKSEIENAIMKITIGVGIVIMGLLLNINLLIAIGTFVIVYGIGKLAIAKYVNKGDGKTE